MKVKFWGVRGSIGSPIKGQAVREKVRKILHYATPADVLDDEASERFLKSLPFSLLHTYGGNTTCLEIRTKNNDLVIVDAGTGLRELGLSMFQEGFAAGNRECAILFTHTHWDHIQGLPFFGPFFIPTNKFYIHSVTEDMEERLRYQHSLKHFPVPFDGMRSQKEFIRHEEGENWELYGMDMTTKIMRHPGNSYSYRFEEDGKVLIFGTDAEFKLDEMDGIDEYLAYFQDADVLIFDTQYTFEEQLQKIDWGHSSASIATDIAMKAGVKKLVLFHHDPSYNDEKLDEAYEGLEIEL